MTKKSEPQTFEHNHQKKIMELLRAGKISSTAGSVTSIDILHDTWCALLAGTGACNCDPEIKIALIRHPGANN